MDPIGTREVFSVIRTMAERGMTVILAEHKVEWIAQFADRVIALHEGKILLDGKPGEVLTSESAGWQRLWYFALHVHCTRSPRNKACGRKTKNYPSHWMNQWEALPSPFQGRVPDRVEGKVRVNNENRNQRSYITPTLPGSKP